ncbi:MAG: hypothetical protein J6T96_05495 [Bacteroidales bacterium]|nr:hypothetical protein [Bacteroidales bacterium]
MSTYYYIYTEVNMNGKWVCINGLVPEFKYDYETHKYKDEREYKLCETYWNGSRSYFGQTYEKLHDLGRRVEFRDLSTELQEKWKSSVESENSGESTWNYPSIVDWDRLRTYIKPDEYDSHGIISKDALFAYNHGDIDELYADDEIDFSKLSDEEKKAYQYHEWDSSYGWTWGIKKVVDEVSHDISRFEDQNNIFFDDNVKYRVVVIWT